MPIQEELMDKFHEKEIAGIKWRLQAYVDMAEKIEAKLLPKTTKMNRALPKGKKIGFYGTHEESAPAQAVNFVNQSEESAYVTKLELNNILEVHKTDSRNETQATTQSATASMRIEIVGDVKGMFSALTKKMDDDKEAGNQEDAAATATTVSAALASTNE